MREIVLINITAQERPGLIATLNAALGEGHAFADGERNPAAAHVLTVMGRAVDPQAFVRVLPLLSEHGLALAGVERLSNPEGANACFELTLTGDLLEPLKWRAQVLNLSQELGLDIVHQAESVHRRQPRLAVFDMDSTLIEAEVIDELAKAAGIGERVATITEQAMRGEIDFRASFTARMALLNGLDVAVLDDIGAQLRLTEGAERLFAELNRMGVKTAILSGGFTYFAKQVQAKLGITYVFANELQVVDGKCTGVAVEPIVDAQRKADLLRELAAQEGVTLEQTVAVGDGANDLAMLAIAGLGVAFRAKPLVRQSARQAISVLGLDGVLYLMGRRDG
ncbi:phosphoserine phosphatase SerB [Pseudomonas sp. UBA4194]|uniref:phosphoserine phosphatase SerB n=1 Tax=Pseudomonas sp. UBA4194 TaxID=1947317 RepID=UPI0025CB7F2D|nr:phosphoserine phosphatase SerB [Pseudomonas sp. UBA4194]